MTNLAVDMCLAMIDGMMPKMHLVEETLWPLDAGEPPQFSI